MTAREKPPGQCQVCGATTENAAAFCIVHQMQHQAEVNELRALGAALGLDMDSETRGMDTALASAQEKSRSRLGLAPRQPANLAKREPEKAPLVPLSEVELENHRSGELDTWWLPKPARDWCEAISAANCAPKSLAVASCMVAAATVLQGRVRVRWKPGVDEPLCLYWFVFSGTGTRKTTIQLRAMRAVLQYQQELADQCAKDTRHILNQRRTKEAQLSRLRRQNQPSKHTDAGKEWLGKIRELEHDLEQLELPKSVEWSQGDVNPSLLPKLLQHNYEAEGIARISVMVSEGAFLHNLMGRHQGSPILEVPLGAINGEPLQFVRASKATDDPVKIRLPNTYMSMCQLLQPHLLDLIKASDISDTGFAGRCIIEVLSSEPTKPDWTAPPVPDAVQSAYDAWLRALIEEDVPDLVDLTLDPAAGRAMRLAYESIEADGSGWSQRAAGIIARLVAIVDIGNLIAKRMADGKTKQRKAPENNLGETPGLGAPSIPKGIHIVGSTEYDWMDDFGGTDYEDLAQLGVRVPPSQAPESIERISMQHELGALGAPSGAQNTGAQGIIKHLFELLHVKRLPLVRTFDRPANSVTALAERVLRHCAGAPSFGAPSSEGVKVRSLWKNMPSKTRPSMDQLYAALEELEQAGAIEWVPDSMRKKGRDARYRSFRLLVRASHLEAVKHKE